MKFGFDIEIEAGNLRVALLIDGEVVWPHPGHDDGSSVFDPEDVVSYLVDAWPFLLLGQTWPIAFESDQEPRSITGLLRAAEDRWEQVSASDLVEVESEEALLDEFLYHHDLSQMKHGSGLNACFVLRQHAHVRLETNGEVYEKIPFVVFAEELTSLGTRAIDLLRSRGGSAAQSIGRWEMREQTDPVTTPALLSGLPRADIERSDDLRLILSGAMADRSISTIANDRGSPIFAAARSSGALGPAGVTEVLRRLQALPDGNVAGVVSLRRRVQQHLHGIELSPRDQGIRAATFVRDWIQQSDDGFVDLMSLSAKLNVRVEHQAIPDRRLDGIAVIGPRHGPSILLNSNTLRQGAGPEDLQRSLRFTWSHEIGHLLLDQEDWPALVDAAKQRVPRSVETRANAFAAYLLLPPRVAYRWWEQDGSPLDWGDLEGLLNRLTENFRLPRIVVSRQLARGAPPERRTPLEQVFRTHIEIYDSPGRWMG
jgi:Zn-dependent peptidase ImmA (M78 family)